MSAFKWTLGGVAGALLGCAIWLGSSTALNARLDILACLVGVLTGAGVYRLSRSGESRFAPGVVAVLTTLFAVGLIKYQVAVSTTESPYQEFWEMTLASALDDESMIAAVADEIVADRLERNQPVAWPDPEMTYAEALWEEDYPAEIWIEAKQRWEQLSPAEQQERIEERREEVDRVIHSYQSPERWAAFGGSFGVWTFVWYVLACLAAFRVAAGWSAS